MGRAALPGQLVPLQVSSLSAITDGAAGFEHSLALKRNGTGYAWGRNAEGRLGDATLVQRTAPEAVSSLDSVVNMAAGIAA